MTSARSVVFGSQILSLGNEYLPDSTQPCGLSSITILAPPQHQASKSESFPSVRVMMPSLGNSNWGASQPIRAASQQSHSQHGT
eukprot:2554411-Amphidinium_carterae.1